MKKRLEAPTLLSGVWRGREDVATLLLVVHAGKGRSAHRQLLHPGEHLSLDGSWSAEVLGPVKGVWAVPIAADTNPDKLLKRSARALDDMAVGRVRVLRPKGRRAAALATDEGELKAILALPPRPFPALPDKSLERAYRDYCDFLQLDLDTELHKLTQNDLDRARKHFRRRSRYVRVGDILQARLNARDAVREYFHLCKTLLNSISIDASNFVERASSWMSLTSKRPGKPIEQFFRVFLQVAGLISKFLDKGATRTVVDTALNVVAIFQATVDLVDDKRSDYPNLDSVHIAKAELLGALTDWKRATEAYIDDTQALILRDAAKLERAGRLVFPQKTLPIIEASGKSWGRTIWLKLLPTRTVLVKEGGERHERKEFNNDEKRFKSYLTTKLDKDLKGTSSKALRSVTYGYFKSTTGKKRRRKYYYNVRRWTLRLGADAETDFSLDAARSLRNCGVTPHDMIVDLKLPILCFSGTPGIPPKKGKNVWSDVYWVGAHGRKHYMNRAQWDPVGKLGKG